MADTRKIGFGPIAAPTGGVLIVFADDRVQFGSRTRSVLGASADLIAKAAKSERFTGKSGSALDIVAPAGTKVSRLIAIGTGKAADRKPQDLVKLGGLAMGRVPSAANDATVLLELADGPVKPDAAADVALGAALRAYSFDRYKTKRKDGDESPAKANVTLAVADVAGARKVWGSRQAVADGVILARDLVNEPPNILYPAEFARRAAGLRKLGVGIDILDVKAMRRSPSSARVCASIPAAFRSSRPAAWRT
jgi:leucyl aminopeptidase